MFLILLRIQTRSCQICRSSDDRQNLWAHLLHWWTRVSADQNVIWYKVINFNCENLRTYICNTSLCFLRIYNSVWLNLVRSTCCTCAWLGRMNNRSQFRGFLWLWHVKLWCVYFRVLTKTHSTCVYVLLHVVISIHYGIGPIALLQFTSFWHYFSHFILKTFHFWISSPSRGNSRHWRPTYLKWDQHLHSRYSYVIYIFINSSLIVNRHLTMCSQSECLSVESLIEDSLDVTVLEVIESRCQNLTEFQLLQMLISSPEVLSSFNSSQ